MQGSIDELTGKLDGAAEAIVKTQDQLPQIMSRGSQEAAEALLRHAAGGQGDGDRIQRDQLNVQRDQLRIQGTSTAICGTCKHSPPRT